MFLHNQFKRGASKETVMKLAAKMFCALLALAAVGRAGELQADLKPARQPQ